MKVRIGIDVGGTFTDAVAVRSDTYELIGTAKIPTTHDAEEGVAAGIVAVLNKIMKECDIRPEDVSFIAHGTTQATNALLEGDVDQVGILTLGHGVEGIKARADTNMGSIPLTAGKSITPLNEFVNNAKDDIMKSEMEGAVEKLRKEGAVSMVVTESFSVDHPENENMVVEYCVKKEIPATAGNDVSKLYGLKVRTRTAVVNASILPKMLDAANMTEESIRNAGIEAPLMIMRCDGGVMTVDEVRKRPILTILSGPAAGVAGALMYEKLTDGIFLEVGGTSTDISCVKDGNVMIRYAEVGGHKTYLNSLDVRTVGIGGGSMIRLENGAAVEVGPRSAHIAGLAYEVYADPSEIVGAELKTIRPVEGDPPYAYIACQNGKKFALTQSGAANICGYVPEGDYAKGSVEAARLAWQPLADSMGLTVEETAKKCLDLSAQKNGKVIESMIHDYSLDPDTLIFVGGGGGASTVVPHLSEVCHSRFRLAKNAPVISPIGVALALVRDMVERTVSNPTEKDILSIRQEAIEKAVAAGANRDSVDVKVEIDTKTNRVRAVAVGATELRVKDLGGRKKTEEELRQIVADNLKKDPVHIRTEAKNDFFCAMSCEVQKKKFLVFRKKECAIRLIDTDGVIRLQRRNGLIHQGKARNWKAHVNHLLEQLTVYSDGGEEVPNLWIIAGSRMIDLSGMQNKEQIFSLGQTELSVTDPDSDLIMLCTRTTENERS
ncbi:MAG: hydantoinase/oxoprolinase family protein [Lachnospiraceae bacterium]|jgi:N-methylhydantoinase A|nr:hydantoinase/oxoprolinase family protein [Lachnospiraceae bacterium]